MGYEKKQGTVLLLIRRFLKICCQMVVRSSSSCQRRRPIDQVALYPCLQGRLYLFLTKPASLQIYLKASVVVGKAGKNKLLLLLVKQVQVFYAIVVDRHNHR